MAFLGSDSVVLSPSDFAVRILRKRSTTTDVHRVTTSRHHVVTMKCGAVREEAIHLTNQYYPIWLQSLNTPHVFRTRKMANVILGSGMELIDSRKLTLGDKGSDISPPPFRHCETTPYPYKC